MFILLGHKEGAQNKSYLESLTLHSKKKTICEILNLESHVLGAFKISNT